MYYITSPIFTTSDITHPIFKTHFLGGLQSSLLYFRFQSVTDRTITILEPYIIEMLFLIVVSYMFLTHAIFILLPLGVASTLLTVISNTPFLNVAFAESTSTVGLNLRL